MAKAKVVEAKVVGSKHAKRMSKRLLVFYVYVVSSDGERAFEKSFATRLEAEKYISKVPRLTGPVIVRIDIPPMEY